MNESREVNPTPLAQRLDQTARRPYSTGEYLRRFAWMLCQTLLIRPSVIRGGRWRSFWLRRFGTRIAPEGASVRPSVRIVHPWLLAIGQRSILGDRVNVYNLGQVTIGSHTVVSQGAHLCAGTHDYTKPDLPLQRLPIHIGSGVWICAEAFIGPGVTIGDNSVVGARAVVVKDVPPGVVVAGNPARVVKDRPGDHAPT